ncbi:MAG TPA: hypothetical protein PLX06_01265 [Fimbriimonadaceae bacterium]|nr:hypothetical protein [Fimbriimonadaceae bacterium]
MTLQAFASETRNQIFEALQSGNPPTIGEFEEARFLDGKSKGKPLMGATRFEPDAGLFEFIYPDPNGAPVVLVVRVESPERIVYLPVPSWVIESIWQGEITGSYALESEAQCLLRDFSARLEPNANRLEFEAKAAIGRH